MAAAVACEAFLFKMLLEDEDMLLAFKVAAARFVDIRSAILKDINGAVKS